MIFRKHAWSLETLYQILAVPCCRMALGTNSFAATLYFLPSSIITSAVCVSLSLSFQQSVTF